MPNILGRIYLKPSALVYLMYQGQPFSAYLPYCKFALFPRQSYSERARGHGGREESYGVPLWALLNEGSSC